MLVTQLYFWADVARTLYTMDEKYLQIRGPWTLLNYVSEFKSIWLRYVALFPGAVPLCIDLTQKSSTKVHIGLSTNYQATLTVCRSDSWF